MGRSFVVVLVVAFALLSGMALSGGRPTQQSRSMPIEREHGFDPFYSSYCHRAGHTPVETANTNLIQGDGLVGIGSNAGCWTPQNEPSIAQSPTNPLDLVVGSNDYRLCCDSEGHNDGTGWAYTSHDGGATWRDVMLPGLTRETGGRGLFANVDSAGDPSLAFAPNGRDVYYANIVFSRTGPLSAVVVSTSHDRGNTWTRPTIVHWDNDGTVFNDKEWITVGDDGRVAVTWTYFKNVQVIYVSPIVGAISTDGARTFGQPFFVSDKRHWMNQGSIPFFAPDGSLLVVHESIDQNWATTIAVSRVHGTHRSTRDVADIYSCLANNEDDRATLTGMQFRFSVMPSASMDPTTGKIAIAYADDEMGCTTGDGASNTQVKLLYVDGAKVSAAHIVTTGRDKAFPAVAYRDGMTTLGFYTRDFTENHAELDYAYASSREGYVEHRLSDGSSNTFMEFKGSFIGDYTGLVVGGDGVGHPVWVDSRGGDQNIYTQSFAP